MGYMTQYTLDIEAMGEGLPCGHQGVPGGTYCPECGVSLLSTTTDLALQVEEEHDFSLDEPMRWYNHESDMARFSTRFPSVLFTLSGEGEESGDLWRKYFYRGQVFEARAVVTYPDFDMGLLRPPKAL
jgi:hypothetical protein